ncbi:MAG: glucose 1-dehydrogenase [Oligoflexales bacterium]
MKALTVFPGVKGACLKDVPEPVSDSNSLLVEMVAVGICGTDREIVEGHYGWKPPNCDYLIIGHESLGRVISAPPQSGFEPGDLVVGIVRRPDPVPCSSCAVMEWDMCSNGLYSERGIKELHGFCSEKFLLEPNFAVRTDPTLGVLGVLLEPTSIVAKAWEQAERIMSRTHYRPARVLITGAGPIGLLAALIGRQRDLEVHVLDKVTSGPKPTLVRELGATYHSDCESLAPLKNTFDLVFECTGSSSLVLQVILIAGPNSVTCLTGVSSGHRKVEVDVSCVARSVVLENGVIFGTVNANKRHYDLAAHVLDVADRGWLGKLITRKVKLNQWEQALAKNKEDIKTIIVLE